MKDFFDALSDLLGSNLVKDNVFIIIIFIVAVISLTAITTVVIFNKLVIPLKLKKSENIMPHYEKILEENKKLKADLAQLKHTKDMITAAESDAEDLVKLQGWEKEFLTKK